jgi:hypothetical protein
LADYVEVGIGAEQIDQSTTNDFVVVDEKDGHHGVPSGLAGTKHRVDSPSE